VRIRDTRDLLISVRAAILRVAFLAEEVLAINASVGYAQMQQLQMGENNGATEGPPDLSGLIVELPACVNRFPQKIMQQSFSSL
jgi:hypothetical protein